MVKQLTHLCASMIILLVTVTACSPQKESINIAVASNFEATLHQLIVIYHQQQPHAAKINVISGSSGVLASQIINNAPFDVFLSADKEKTDAITDKLNLNTTSQVYAIGQLALWIPDEPNHNDCINKLNNVKSLALPNPETAPYGFVAKSIIEKANITIKKTIQTSNVTQAYLYTRDQLTEAGFVAKSLLIEHQKGCVQTFNDDTLQQNMLLLHPKAKGFYDFILSEKAQSFIQDSGYRIES